jgi:hypothetical protein
MRTALLVIGIIAIAMGLVWAGQGSGYFPYPKSSVMINQAPWIYRGALLTAVGFALAVASRWIG